MRYADGGGLTVAGRRRREAVRVQAAELFEQNIKPPEVARRLRASLKSAYEPDDARARFEAEVERIHAEEAREVEEARAAAERAAEEARQRVEQASRMRQREETAPPGEWSRGSSCCRDVAGPVVGAPLRAAPSCGPSGEPFAVVRSAASSFSVPWPHWCT
nr:hypothetical protein [Streptomyces sp. NRRL F-2664]